VSVIEPANRSAKRRGVNVNVTARRVDTLPA
jgi:hypothetical protein